MSAITPAYVKALLELVDHCIAGALDDAKLAEMSEALRKFDYSGDTLLDHAVHQLHHFVQDTDIRSRDPEYGAIQRQELRQIANQIRESYRQYVS